MFSTNYRPDRLCNYYLYWQASVDLSEIENCAWVTAHSPWEYINNEICLDFIYIIICNGSLYFALDFMIFRMQVSVDSWPVVFYTETPVQMIIDDRKSGQDPAYEVTIVEIVINENIVNDEDDEVKGRG